MEVNAFQSNTSGASSNNKYPPKLTDEVKEQLKKEGRCFRCREKGHLSAHCPVFLRTATPFTPRATPGPSVRAAAPVTTTTGTEPSTSVPADTVKEASDLFTKIRSLSGEQRGKMASYLKDIMADADF